MPKKGKELSALAVSKLKEQGRYAVGGADDLHLRVAWVRIPISGSGHLDSGAMLSGERSGVNNVWEEICV